MPDDDEPFSPELAAWLDARSRAATPPAKPDRVAKGRRSSGASGPSTSTKGLPQQIHATKIVGDVATTEHVEFTVENWRRWIKDPCYSRMYTHPSDECVSPVEVVKRARKEAGLE